MENVTIKINGQEIEASPTDPQRVYQMDVFVHVTRDGGKTFNNLETGKEKHSDNHALWIDPEDGGALWSTTTDPSSGNDVPKDITTDRAGYHSCGPRRGPYGHRLVY